jgi:hypothetical protein
MLVSNLVLTGELHQLDAHAIGVGDEEELAREPVPTHVWEVTSTSPVTSSVAANCDPTSSLGPRSKPSPSQ